MRITWFGHSTVLVDLDGVRVLTDPLFRGRIFHVRRVAAPVDVTSIGQLDAVLVSHLHYDHLDLASVARLGRGVRMVVPAGAGELLRKRGFTDVTEVAVDAEVDVGGVTVRATYAEHESRRLFGKDAPAVGYLVDGSSRVYFAGDTDLFDDMHALAPDLDVALLPVAGWGPRLPAGHLDPRGAAEALARLRPRVAVPIHWGTYRRIGLDRRPETLRAPAESFARFARELAPDVDVRVLQVGDTLELEASTGGLAEGAASGEGARS